MAFNYKPRMKSERCHGPFHAPVYSQRDQGKVAVINHAVFTYSRQLLPFSDF